MGSREVGDRGYRRLEVTIHTGEELPHVTSVPSEGPESWVDPVVLRTRVPIPVVRLTGAGLGYEEPTPEAIRAGLYRWWSEGSVPKGP